MRFPSLFIAVWFASLVPLSQQALCSFNIPSCPSTLGISILKPKDGCKDLGSYEELSNTINKLDCSKSDQQKTLSQTVKYCACLGAPIPGADSASSSSSIPSSSPPPPKTASGVQTFTTKKVSASSPAPQQKASSDKIALGVGIGIGLPTEMFMDPEDF